MKRSIAVWLLVVAMCSVALASSPGPIFRDLCWGDPLEKLGEVTALGSDKDGIEMYLKADEELWLGPLPVTMIAYGFFQGELMIIAIEAEDVKMLSQVAKTKYGKPEGSSQFALDEVYMHGDTFCVVKEQFFGKTGYMGLMSISIATKRDAWKQAQVNAASEAF